MTLYGSIQPDAASAARRNGDSLLGEDDANGEETPLVQGNSPANGKPASNFGENKPLERSLWSKLTFLWFTPILHRGNDKKKLDQADLDLVPIPPDCQTEEVTSLFDASWEIELGKPDPSLVRALVRAFAADYIRAGFLKMVHDLCVFVGPQVLHAMIVFLRDPKAPLWHGLGLTLAVTVSQLAMSLCVRHYFFKCYTTGLRIRTAIVVAIYRKALVLSASERQTRTLGEITNLMSIDAQRLQEMTTYLHSLWSSPLQIGLALFFLWGQLGLSSLGGVSVIIIMIPVTKSVAKWMGMMQKMLMKAKDERVNLNGEVLAGMKVIKFQAWEESFQKRVLVLRETELRHLFRYYIGTSFSRMLWVFTPMMVALSTFTAYIVSGHQLDVASALTALALFDILRFPLFMLPQVMSGVVEASVAMNRLRSFLLSDEHNPVGPGSLEDVGICVDNLSAAYDSKRPRAVNPADKELVDKDWEIALLKSQLADAERCIRQLVRREQPPEQSFHATSSLLCLSRINFELKPGELVAVVGGVGCGKTSFLNAILGEVRELTGSTSVNGKLAFFCQTPFIMNASVRDNILFGHVDEPVNEELYQRALSCCALRHDLELLPDGEHTEIGEKGITLSGGQKARVALARAVYHNADITLLDDALSAVDAHVSKHLFDEAILGELMKQKDGKKKRSVVLVTNALEFLKHPKVDRIVVLQDGRVIEQGTYVELAQKSDSTFARFLSVLSETRISGTLNEEFDFTEEMDPSESPINSARRRSSIKKPSDVDAIPKKLMTEETRETGNVGLGVYLSWFHAAGGLIAPVAILLSFTSAEAVSVLSNWWLTYWSGHDSESQFRFLAGYALINLVGAVSGLVRMILIASFSLKASRELFSGLLSVVLHAPMSFFDTTPVGRLVNRFSKDIYTIDEQLSATLSMYLQTLFSVLSTIVVISGVTPFFTICLVPICGFYLIEQKYFTLTYRELKRLDSVNRSPIYALLGESIDGVAVIRAYSAAGTLTNRFTSILNVQQHAYFLTCAAQSWLAVRLELIGTLIITFAALNAVVERALRGADDRFAGLAGLAISYALSATQSLNWSVRMASDMEANMVAVERVREYSQIESEGSRETKVDRDLPEDWPTHGEIEFQGVELRYRPGLPLVLKGLDLRIPRGSKVGIVGRTGAGKSTLMVALMRIVECEVGGKILIDGSDTRTIGLAKLRKNLAVIPQDPVLFSGSVRSNLDPFNEYADVQLYEVLESVGLYKSIVDSTHSLSSIGLARVESLDDIVSESGINYSVGQRQLIVIARALLRGAKIVVMDEATAAVDAETDAAIQRVMRTEFANATCLTVAHRLNTVMDSDYILVMDDGRAAEFDTPKSLLQKGGMFRELVKAASSD